MEKKKSFWTLTGIASVIVALTGLYIAMNPVSKDTIPHETDPTSSLPSTTNGQSPLDWPLIAEDTFTTERLGWDVGSFPTHNNPIFNPRVVDGKYRWDISFTNRWQNYIISPYGLSFNFDVAVDVKMTEFTGTTSVCLIFGYTRNVDYQFNISSNGNYILIKYNADVPQMIIDWTPINVEFDPKTWNRVRVKVDQQLISLYLNSERLGEYRYIGFAGGEVGLGVEMYQAGAAVIDFDNFQFRSKP